MNQRELILLPFPFSDLSGKKVRPALIISNDRFNKSSEDVIVCAVTSNVNKSPYSVVITQKELEGGTLFVKSCIKVENILKVKKSLIIKVIGKIDIKTFLTVKNVFDSLV
ncbi:type II toxin-antitoxin system PemK/MazF family toxin [archaeon]|nr:type II toxin-antitoxin system PemK/MazF family toxin [archaeon]